MHLMSSVAGLLTANSVECGPPRPTGAELSAGSQRRW